MKTIAKRADQLQPGDISRQKGVPDAAYVVVGITNYMGTVTACCIAKGALGERIFSRRFEFKPEDPVFVEAPCTTLTPNQERADELAEMLRQGVKWNTPLHGIPTAPWVAAARVLLDEIDPPKPPTLEEMAKALDVAARGLPLTADIHTIVDRARKAGLL